MLVFDPHEYYMDLCNESWLTGRFAWQNFNIGHYMQTVQPNLFIPAMLIGTIDFYNVMLLSLTLTVPGSHNVSAKYNLSAAFSYTLFI